MTPTLRSHYLYHGRRVQCIWIDWTGQVVGLLRTDDGRQLAVLLSQFTAAATPDVPVSDIQIGQRVRVMRTAVTSPRISRLAEIALNSRGTTTYVLEDGGRMDRSEITPA